MAAVRKPVASPETVAAAPQVAREPARPIIPGRAVGYTRDGRPIQRAAADTGVDSFHVPPDAIPPGRSWEWKTETVLGQKDDHYLSKLYQVGWEHVMYEQCPGVFAPVTDVSGNKMVGPVRRGGLMLMERDAILTKEARDDDKRKADEKTGNARRQYSTLNTSGTSTVEIDHEARRMSGIRQNYEPVPDPSGRQPID